QAGPQRHVAGHIARRRCSWVASRQGSPPSSRAVPASARSSPSRTRRVVVLPAPLGPRKPCTSPVRTSRSRPSRARVGPKVFTSPEIEIVVAIWSFTASSGDALAVLIVHTLHLFHELVNGIRAASAWRRRRGGKPEAGGGPGSSDRA